MARCVMKRQLHLCCCPAVSVKTKGQSREFLDTKDLSARDFIKCL